MDDKTVKTSKEWKAWWRNVISSRRTWLLTMECFTPRKTSMLRHKDSNDLGATVSDRLRANKLRPNHGEGTS